METERDVMELEDSKEALESFIESYMKLEKKFERPKNIFSIIKGPKEAKFQYALEYFLDPKQPHGFKDTILKAFLELISEKESEHYRELSSRIKSHHVELQTEVGVYGDEDDEGRIDLIIAGGPSSCDVPEWAIFIELKVGASEGEEQTRRYAIAGSWNFKWFGKDTFNVKDLDECHYIYIRKENESQARSKDFVSLSWRDLVNAFKNKLDRGMFDYPHRSVIQFLDFLRSLKDVENMGDEKEKRDLELVNERLNLYFEQKELIEKFEEANRQFQQDFNELADQLHSRWEDRLQDIYDFTRSGWTTRQASQRFREYDKLYPKYWSQREGDLEVFFVHSTTTDSLRKSELHFRLRLPPQRKVHRMKNDNDKSFNDLFCKGLNDKKSELIEILEKTKLEFTSAGAVLSKTYDLNQNNLYNSYIRNLEKACDEFCSNEKLMDILFDIFENSYEEAFGETFEGESVGVLEKK